MVTSLKHFVSFVKSFSISGFGEAQVKSQVKLKSHNDKTSSANQSTFITENGKFQLSVPTKVMFSPEEQVLQAEVLKVLHGVNSNYSFASSENDERFKIMFPDSKIAQSYRQGKTKFRYNIQYGIAPHIKQMLIYDVNNTPFTFKFDESTISQVKKQCDTYLQFWSKK